MMNHRHIYFWLILAGLTALHARIATAEHADGERYNVLFIAIDDLNDWVGCLGGNPQAITPNFDRYARDHAMVMNEAYCPSTVCGPTRSALLTGKHATYTGVYGNGQNLKHVGRRQVWWRSAYLGCCGRPHRKNQGLCDMCMGRGATRTGL